MSLPRLTGLVVPAALLTVLSGSLMLSACSSLFSKDSDHKKDLGPTQTEQGYYQIAQHSLNTARFDDAAKNLESLETYYPIGAYTEQAQLDLMYARFRNGDYAPAIEAADRFIKLYPQDPQVDYAYYLRGVANMETGSDTLMRFTNLSSAHRDIGYLRAAYDNFRDLITKFPQSTYAPDAAQRMRYIDDQFAESEMNVARYYIQRKAYVASIDRARWVVEYYPQTPQVPEALATLVFDYQELGMDDLANQYLAVLRANYPQLVHGNKVNLAESRGEASTLNKMTLGILGRPSEVIIQNQASPLPNQPAPVNYGVTANPAASQNNPSTFVQVKRWIKHMLSNPRTGNLGDQNSQATSPSQISSASPSAPGAATAP